jgi:flagellar biosynthesis chaperone FliJ
MYSEEQIEELKMYEESIRNEAVKKLCNGKQVTKMRMVIRNLLDHVDQQEKALALYRQFE